MLGQLRRLLLPHLLIIVRHAMRTPGSGLPLHERLRTAYRAAGGEADCPVQGGHDLRLAGSRRLAEQLTEAIVRAAQAVWDTAQGEETWSESVRED